MYDLEKKYDETSPISIEQYAQKLIGKTFKEVVDVYSKSNFIVSENIRHENEYENKKRKGGLGELIEEHFFHYKCNNDSTPDFDQAGVELKVTPYKQLKNGGLSAKERLIITMIDYYAVVNEAFEEGHLWAKAQLILLVYYLYESGITNRLDYKINYAKLFALPEQDLKIIKHDYETIVNKIKAGKAHELSEGDTMYLGAAPKAATSKDRRKQPFNDELAKPRAFAFKTSYMTYVLNNYIVPGKTTYEPIIKESGIDSIEEYVVKKIDRYKNWTVDELCMEFGIDPAKKPKSLGALLIYRILGIKGNRAEEFVKANIIIKTIRLNNNNTIKESMSFPKFKFKEVANEDWEESKIKDYLSQSRFLFVVYKFNAANELVLRGCQFWNIPYSDLEEEVFRVWKKTKQVLNEGLVIEKKGNRNTNNFPKQSESNVCHVRPHARDSSDVDELPDGRMYPKQCFWLNNTYIVKQLEERFF